MKSDKCKHKWHFVRVETYYEAIGPYEGMYLALRRGQTPTHYQFGCEKCGLMRRVKINGCELIE